MANWKMTTGENLRMLIESNDESESNCKLILEEIIKEYGKIQKFLKLDTDIFEFTIESIQCDIYCECFDTDTVNYHMRYLYDWCDTLKVWIKL